MSKQQRGCRVRRTHSEEFKREAVKMVTDQGQSLAATARHLDVNPNLLRRWKAKFEQESSDGDGLSDDERLELGRLRAENQRLRMQRDILKKLRQAKFGRRGLL